MKIAFDVDVLAKQSMDINWMVHQVADCTINISNSPRIQGSIHFTNIHCSQKSVRWNIEKH